MIDKIDGCLDLQVPVDDIRRRADEAGLVTEITKLNGKSKPHLRFYPTGGINFELFNHKSKYVRVFKTIPSRFGKFRNYWAFFRQLLSAEDLLCAGFYRNDLCIDIPENFDSIFSGIYVERKQCSKLFGISDHWERSAKGNKNTGLQLGKAPEEILLYDKYEKEKKKLGGESFGWTRLEVRVTKRKKPCSGFEDLPKLPVHFGKLGYFKNIKLKRATYYNRETLTSNQRELRGEFRGIARELGIHRAYRSCNRAGNFKRDFKPIVKLEDADIDFNKLLGVSLNRFFDGWDSSCFQKSTRELRENLDLSTVNSAPMPWFVPWNQ